MHRELAAAAVKTEAYPASEAPQSEAEMHLQAENEELRAHNDLPRERVWRLECGAAVAAQMRMLAVGH